MTLAMYFGMGGVRQKIIAAHIGIGGRDISRPYP